MHHTTLQSVSALRLGRRRATLLAALLALPLAGSLLGAAPPKVDSALPSYAPSADVRGTVRVAGNASATAHFADACEAFRKAVPAVSYNWGGDQSQQGAAALIAGDADVAVLGRPLSAKERSDFQAKYGSPPVEIVFAFDAIAVIVPKDSPVRSLTSADVAALFAAAPAGRSTAKTWADVGVTDAEYAKLPVEAHASRTIDDLAAAITNQVLGGGELRADARNQKTQGAIVTGAAKKGAVGLVSPSAVTGGVRVVPVAASAGGQAVAPTSEAIASGAYPYGRKLYASFVGGSKGQAQVAELARFILSREGQQAIASRGGIALPESVAGGERAKISR